MAVGSARLAVPTCTVCAPAIMNSTTSVPVMTPPRPQTGIFTAFATCHTIRSATGLMAGPERPPVTLPRIGVRVRVSMAMPRRVLMREIPSAPASSTAFAMETTSVTFGDSLMMTGRSVLSFTARVTAAAALGSVPKATPPTLTLGQEIFTSRALMPGTERSFAHSAYSSTDFPTMLAM